jgi:hypothetical protein
MRKHLLVLLGASALLLMACDASGLVSQFLPQKQLQEVSATLEAVAPTVAAVATSGASKASATQPAASKTSATSSGNPFADALGKAKTATKFRVEFSWIFGGMDKGKYQETPFIDFSGEVDGQNSHMTSKGGLVAMLAKDANTPVEIIEAGGTTYMKGTIIAPDPKLWYITDDSTTSSFADFATVDAYKDWMGGVQSGDIKKARSEKLDNQNCDVYVYDMKSLQNTALSGFLGFAGDKNAFSVIDKGETDFWLCGDGFVHKFLLDYEGHNSKDATQKAALKMNWHAWDFNNAAIAVTAPKDAKKLQ